MNPVRDHERKNMNKTTSRILYYYIIRTKAKNFVRVLSPLTG